MPHEITGGNNSQHYKADFLNAETTVEASFNVKNLDLVTDALDEDRYRQKKRFASTSLLHFSSEKTVADLASKHITKIKVVW